MSEHEPRKIILCKTRGDEIMQMHWAVHSTPTSEMLARNFAKKSGWTVHFYGEWDFKALEKAAKAHKEQHNESC